MTEALGREPGLGVSAGVIAVLLALPTLAAPPNAYDGGIAASNATFILHGALPYRDFWLLYGPLSGYLVAAATWIAGPSLDLLRVLGMSVLFVQAVGGYFLARAFAGPATSVVATVSGALVAFAWTGPDLSAWALAMALATVSLALAFRSRGGFALMLGGIGAGLAFLARLDVGTYALIALIVGLRRRSMATIVGFAAVVAPVALVFLLKVPVDELYAQLVWFPTVGQREFRALPRPLPLPIGDTTASGWISSLLFQYLPVALLIATTVRLWRRGWAPAAVLALTVFAILVQLQASVRSDAHHAAQAATPALLAGAWLAEGLTSRPSRPLARMAIVAPAAFALVNAASLVSTPSPYYQALTSAASYLAAQTVADESILVGETSRKYGFANPLLAYYLADRPSGVHVAQYNPGVTTTREVQEEMVSELDLAKVRYLLLDRMFAEYCEPWNRSCEPGPELLDRYIADHYRVDRDWGAIVVMVRK